MSRVSGGTRFAFRCSDVADDWKMVAEGEI